MEIYHPFKKFLTLEKGKLFRDAFSFSCLLFSVFLFAIFFNSSPAALGTENRLGSGRPHQFRRGCNKIETDSLRKAEGK